MGLSSKTKKQTTSEKSHSVSAPNVPSWATNNYKDYAKSVGSFGQMSPQTIGPSELQQAGFNSIANLKTGGDANAMAIIRGLMNFAPQQVNAGQMFTPQQVSATGVDVGQLKDMNFNPYLNPYTGEVENKALEALNRATQGQIADNQGRATQAKAYGGGRHGVVDAGIYEGQQRQAGELSAALRHAGFLDAKQSALADISNKYGADTFNSGQKLQAAGMNQNANLTAGLQGNADQLQAALANQQAELSGAGLKLDAAGKSNSMNSEEFARQVQQIGLMSEAGGVQRGIAQENDPWKQQAMQLMMRAGLMQGMNAGLFTGQTTDATGESTTKTKETSSGMEVLGQLISTFGPPMFGMPPIPVKK